MIEILAVALAVDILFGEPRFHIVTYFAKIIEFLDKKYRRRGKFLDFLAGSLLMIFIIFLAIFIVFLAEKIENYYLKILILSYLLKVSFSIRSLFEHLNACLTEDIEELRKNVSKIVSRKTENLKKGHLYSASIESLADNIVDAVFSPLFYFALFGVYGAFLYRIINLADSIIGYKNEKYMYFGKLAAKLDDIFNYIPSRILLIVLLIYCIRDRDVRDALIKNFSKYGKYRFKVNYLPIVLYAFILNVKLEKIGRYCINESCALPKREDLERAISLTKRLILIYILLISLCLFYRS